MKNRVGFRAAAIAGALAFAVVAGVASADNAPAPQQPQPTPQSAPPPQQTPPQQSVTLTKDPMDEVVCKKQELSGSRIGGKKVCKTRREWVQAQNDARRFMSDSDRASSTNNPTMGTGN